MFEESLSRLASDVDMHCERILKERERVVPGRLLEAMRHGLVGGGKRYRAFLLMASASIFGVPQSRSMAVAVALECVHCFSLIHDDMPAMDDSPLRRGKPTVHREFGEALAILAGDGLLAAGFEILAGEESLSADLRLSLVSALSRAAGGAGMTGGQALDMEICRMNAREEEVERLQKMKTGALLRFAVDAGGMLGGADESARLALGSYGTAIGSAFQIADDLLDVEGDPLSAGKELRKDEREGKATLVHLLGVDEARRRLESAVEEGVSHLSGFGSEADRLREAAYYLAGRRG